MEYNSKLMKLISLNKILSKDLRFGPEFLNGAGQIGA